MYTYVDVSIDQRCAHQRLRNELTHLGVVAQACCVSAILVLVARELMEFSYHV